MNNRVSSLLAVAGLLLTGLWPLCAPGQEKFTLAVIPDSQQEVLRPEDQRLQQRMEWIVANKNALTLKMVLHVGDLMNWDTSDHIQYERASAALALLDKAKIPYVLALGNHDTAATTSGGSAAPGKVNTNLRNTATYNTYFPPSRFSALGGVYETGKIDNAYHTFRAGGLDWLVLNLELWPRAGAVDWARTVLESHPTYNAIVLTHSHLNARSDIEQTKGGYGDNSPQYVFDHLLKEFANVRLVFSGHVGSHGYRQDVGTHRNAIHQFLQCYHDNAANPVRLFEIDPVRGTIQTRVYCPSTGHDKDDGSTMTLTNVNWIKPSSSPSAASQSGVLEKAEDSATTRWPAAKAWQWYRSHPWLVGCNFLPSTAVNDVEMWQKESFDAQTIDRELGWAQELGFNTVRVFVNYAVWEADAAGLKETFRQFLKIADQHGISTLVVLFDDCFNPEPRVGKQLDPEPGVHNSQWAQSPGVKRRGDRAAWPKLEQYVKDMVSAFASDRRVLAWELYNEPSASLPLVEAAFQWAREAKSSQPITTTIYGNAEMQRRISELSDVLCFHNYGPLAGVSAEVARLPADGRPVLCTEWMARGGGSRFETHLPFFKENKIACWNWGLVAGRTQTYFPWGSPKGAPEPKLWHHDILRTDGTPFKAREVEFIKVMTGKLSASALPQRRVLVPTAEKSPVPWRYTLEKPADDWFKPEFNDGAWKQGAAPFGTGEPPIARKPNTVWTSADLWLRREFEMPPKFTDLALLLHHDEDTEVYINGVLAVKAGGYNAAYDSFDLAPEAQLALKPGKNLVAAHCHQTVGGQYLDLGIEGVARSLGTK